MVDLPTIEEIERDLYASNPRLADDTVKDTAARRWRLLWHNRQLAQLCEAASDPERARSLLEWNLDRSQPLAVQIQRAKAMLVGSDLLSLQQARAFDDEPGEKMLAGSWANKMLTPTEANK